jgi:predicted phosphate transport protein (TIGR00153 family)
MPIFGGFFSNKADTALQSLFSDQTANIVQCAQNLERFFADLKAAEQIMQHIVECEHEGDHITRQVHEVLDRAFLTSWLDKSDATDLADNLDNFLDGMRAVARSVRLYGVLEVRREVAKFTAIVVSIAKLVEEMLRHLKCKDYANVAEHYQTVSRLEQEADDLRDIAIKDLWKETVADPRSFIAWKEIIEGLEKISDRGHHISQTILSICRKCQ